MMKQLKSFNFTDAQRKKLASIILKLDKEKQDILVSGDNIATINGQSLLNGGNISLIKTGIFTIVTELPTNDIDKDKVYLVPSTKTDNENKFSEYIYTDNGWEKLGEFKADVDLSPYAKALNLPNHIAGFDGAGSFIYMTPYPNEVRINFKLHNLINNVTTNNNVPIFEASQSEAGVMSASDKVKLDGIEKGAQVNKIESVSVNGTPLEITNKGVDIPIHEYTAGFCIKLENGNTFSLMYSKKKAPVDQIISPDQSQNYISIPFFDYNGPYPTTESVRGIYEEIVIKHVSAFKDNEALSGLGLGLISWKDYNKFNAKQDALTEAQLNNINNAITSISVNDVEQINTNGTVNLTIPNATPSKTGLMSKEDKAKLDSQPTIKASDATGVTDDDYVVIKKSELDSILSRLSALENKA